VIGLAGHASPGLQPDHREGRIDSAPVATRRLFMTWDDWTFLVLSLTALSAVRPVCAAFAQRYGPATGRQKQSLMRASGGAAMLTLAAYLMADANVVIGRGFWDMALLAVQTPFMRTLPIVWVPSLCWVLLVILGCWFLYQGARESRGRRDPMIALWAFNEAVVFAALLWWGLYVPDDWNRAPLINFGLEGIYLGCLVGAVVRFGLVMRGPPGGIWRPDQRGTQPKARHWLGRVRRY
jgi:hypothetical protein